MKCLLYAGITSMKEDTSAHLSGRGEPHEAARVITLATLKQADNPLLRYVIALCSCWLFH